MTAITPVVDQLFTVDPGSVGAATTLAVDITVPGAKIGMSAIVTAPTALDAGLGVVGAGIYTQGIVTMRLMNATAGAINPASGSYRVVVF